MITEFDSSDLGSTDTTKLFKTIPMSADTDSGWRCALANFYERHAGKITIED